MRDDMDRARRLGYHFAAKLVRGYKMVGHGRGFKCHLTPHFPTPNSSRIQVRGAYMISERKRALELGYPSPIHDTIEATHACYDGNVQMALEAMARGEKVEVLVASHNQASIEKAVAAMGALGLEPAASGVYFGQVRCVGQEGWDGTGRKGAHSD